MNLNFKARLRRIEGKKNEAKYFVVVKDSNGLYTGGCGKELSKVEFEAWLDAQPKDTRMIFSVSQGNLSRAQKEDLPSKLQTQNKQVDNGGV